MPGISITTALLIASAATSAAGTAQSVRAARRGGKAAQAAANAEADMMDYNAAVAEISATQAAEQGEVEAARYKEQVEGVIGSQRAGYAGQGVDVSSGSALAVQADTAAIAEMDALQIKSNAARTAWGYKVEAYDNKKRAVYARQEGVMMAAAGRAQANAALIGGVGGIITTGLNYSMQRYGFGHPGDRKPLVNRAQNYPSKMYTLPSIPGYR
jgi:hypothetical protein